MVIETDHQKFPPIGAICMCWSKSVRAKVKRVKNACRDYDYDFRSQKIANCLHYCQELEHSMALKEEPLSGLKYMDFEVGFFLDDHKLCVVTTQQNKNVLCIYNVDTMPYQSKRAHCPDAR